MAGGGRRWGNTRCPVLPMCLPMRSLLPPPVPSLPIIDLLPTIENQKDQTLIDFEGHGKVERVCRCTTTE